MAKDYASIPRGDGVPSVKSSRALVLAAVGMLCAVGAVLALVNVQQLEQMRVNMVQVSETQALAELSKSDKMLAQAYTRSSPSSAALKKAAAMLEQRQEAKIAATSKELAHEEQQRVDVKSAAAKLLAEAQKQDNSQALQRKVARAKDAAELQFEKTKNAALQQAQKTIAAAESSRHWADKRIKQQLGANNDKYLDMNPPNHPEMKDPYSDLDPPVVRKVAKAQKLGANNDIFLDMNAPNVPKDPYSDLDPPVVHKANAAQKLGANNDIFLDMNPPNPPGGKDDFTDLDPPVVHKGGSKGSTLSGVASAKDADSQVEGLEKELAAAKVKASSAEKALVQHLSGFDVATPGYDKSDPDSYKPVFYENYEKGMLGPGAGSKRVPKDHPEGHKDCALHDIDCDELYPWAKHPDSPTEPEDRNGVLGDNMVGVFGQDDVVVNTADSGLRQKAVQSEEKMGHLEEDSKENKNMLYGNARKAMSQRFFGVGDSFVPLKKVEEMEAHPNRGGHPLSDFVFGTWQQGFQKPTDKTIRRKVNMFDQPYRQHWAAARGGGKEVYKTPPTPNAYGGPVGLGPTKGDDKEDDDYTWDDQDEEETQAADEDHPEGAEHY